MRTTETPLKSDNHNKNMYLAQGVQQKCFAYIQREREKKREREKEKERERKGDREIEIERDRETERDLCILNIDFFSK